MPFPIVPVEPRPPPACVLSAGDEGPLASCVDLPVTRRPHHHHGFALPAWSVQKGVFYMISEGQNITFTLSSAAPYDSSGQGMTAKRTGERETDDITRFVR